MNYRADNCSEHLQIFMRNQSRFRTQKDLREGFIAKAYKFIMKDICPDVKVLDLSRYLESFRKR